MTQRLTVALVHWKAAEAGERLERLTEAGLAPYHLDFSGSTSLAPLRKDPPDAVVIDLGRLPSHGLEIGCAIRASKTTRGLPLVFVDGKPDKVERVRGELPDATFCVWTDIGNAVTHAIHHPPLHPSIPVPHLERPNTTALVRKLGIKAGMKVGLWDAPENVARILGDLPRGTALVAEGQCELTLYFVTTLVDLEARTPELLDAAGRGGLWICWPKMAQKVIATDLKGGVIRDTLIAAGLVDHKVCRVDDVWSGLRFAVKS